MDIEEWKIFAKYHSAIMSMFMTLWRLGLIRELMLDRSQIIISPVGDYWNSETYNSKEYIKKYSARMNTTDIKVAEDMMNALLNLGFFKKLSPLTRLGHPRKSIRPIELYRCMMRWNNDSETLK